jgi:hypothetical protein
MTTLQFGLFFAALLIGYVLIHIRLMRFETYLREVSALKIVNERLQGVTEVLNRVDLAVVEERLEMMCERLGSLSEIGERIERALERTSREPAGVAALPVAVSAGERIRALVETRLLSLGYRNLHILTDLASASGGEELAVTVECEKNQTTFKGKVVTCNGEIRDVNLQSVTQAFP